jgi:hypothetical protein
VLVLRDAEAPGDDHPLRRQVRVRELPDVGLGNAGALDEVGPGGGRDESSVLVEAVRVVFDELSVEHGGADYKPECGAQQHDSSNHVESLCVVARALAHVRDQTAPRAIYITTPATAISHRFELFAFMLIHPPFL